MERQTSELWGRRSRVLSQLTFDNVRAYRSPAYFFLMGYYESNFNYQIFYFQVYGNMVEENRIYQWLQKIFSEKVYSIKLFPAIMGKSEQNVLCTPKKLPAPTLCLWTYIQISAIHQQGHQKKVIVTLLHSLKFDDRLFCAVTFLQTPFWKFEPDLKINACG